MYDAVGASQIQILSSINKCKQCKQQMSRGPSTALSSKNKWQKDIPRLYANMGIY